MENAKYKIEKVDIGLCYESLRYKFYLYKKMWYGWSKLDWWYSASDATETMMKDVAKGKKPEVSYYNEQGDLISND